MKKQFLLILALLISAVASAQTSNLEKEAIKKEEDKKAKQADLRCGGRPRGEPERRR
jgi:Na+-transporting methylmalonyl-CoA/oxaloacetate decarboxylase gamma subunit